MVIGASIRYGHFHPALDRFVKKHTAALNKLPGAFYSVNLVARKPENVHRRPTATRASFAEFAVAARPVCRLCRGAALSRYRWYDRFMIRLIMKMTGGETDTRKEVVYTDWTQVSSFARDIAHLSPESRRI